MLVLGVNVLLLDPVAPTPNNIVAAAKRADVPVIDYLNPPVGMEPATYRQWWGTGRCRLASLKVNGLKRRNPLAPKSH